MSWLIGVTDGLLDHVRRVAQERVPSDSWDRERRLNIIARSTIENGDKAETLALVADLTAYAASDL